MTNGKNVRQPPEAEASLEFQIGATKKAGGPTSDYLPARAEAYNVGVSLGLSSYFSHELVEMVEHPQNIAGAMVNGNQPRRRVAGSLSDTVHAYTRIVKISSQMAVASKRAPYPYASLPECDPEILGDFDSQHDGIRREFNRSVVVVRETTVAHLMKLDVNAGRAAALAPTSPLRKDLPRAPRTILRSFALHSTMQNRMSRHWGSM